jgi:hypothetical protein
MNELKSVWNAGSNQIILKHATANLIMLKKNFKVLLSFLQLLCHSKSLKKTETDKLKAQHIQSMSSDSKSTVK